MGSGIMANYHLAILKKPYLQAILSGRKRIESRFTRIRREPFGMISAGDTIFLKQSSGPVCGMASVRTVMSFEHLTPREILQIKQRYNHEIGGDEEFWESKFDCRFGVLIWLAQVRDIKPVRIGKKDLRGWVVLTEKENFGLLESVLQYYAETKRSM